MTQLGRKNFFLSNGCLAWIIKLFNNNIFILINYVDYVDPNYLSKSSSEDYLKSFFPDRIENLKLICNYCLKNPPSKSIMKSLREEFFNLNYQGTSAKRVYELLSSNQWLK